MKIESGKSDNLYNVLIPPPSTTRGSVTGAYGTPDNY